MATSFSPKPSFHLCPDFSIAPPPDGHLELGSVLRGLDLSSILSPLDFGDTVKVPESQLFPVDKPSEKRGFSRSLKELRGLEGNIWAKLFGGSGLGVGFSALRQRENDETLTVKKLYVRYFIPTAEYMKNALEIDGVSFYVNSTSRKQPVYMITGLMWTEGSKLSKIQSKKTKVSGEAAATDPNTGTSAGGSAAYNNEANLLSSFDGSTPFILGIRTRKIWWDKDGTRRDEEYTAGSTLGGFKGKKEDVTDGLMFVDDQANETPGQVILYEGQLEGEEGAVVWILPD
ncbi:hypothetical protein NW762_008855 [Fusarium torreyae]|uniref:Uncharacterized protein n=1 Tax=Fusarium torreyae TaxID=1237075 RepID=A0A9W8RYL7_9HYPO|nr:hypothetical protein NW762_008855 [Fusarium torreyae]